MLKVKEKYLQQVPPNSKLRLGEYTQRQLEKLPEYLKNEYLVKTRKSKKDEVED